MPNTTNTLDMIFRYVNSWVFLFLFVSAVVYLFYVANKRQRLAIVAIILSSMVFINDFVLRFVEEVMGEGQRYYRYLWTFPLIFIIITCIVDAYGRWNNTVVRLVIIVISAVLMAVQYYNSDQLRNLNNYNPFNLSVVSSEVIAMGDKLDELSEKKIISVACPDSLYGYFRMYNGHAVFMTETKIITPDEENRIDFGSDNPDVDSIMGTCCARGLDYLIVRLNDKSKAVYEEYGFTPIFEAEGLGIYKCTGYEGIKKEYTNWGQVSRETYVDEEGNPSNGERGYATIHYEYDKHGNLTREYYTDAEGKKAAEINTGKYSVERKYDRRNRCLAERAIGVDGKSIKNSFGSAEIRWTYKGRKIASEEYFDANGNRVSIAPGYSIKKYEYDKKDNIISESYYDDEGKPVNCVNGYTVHESEYDGKDQIVERFKDTEGKLVVTGSGYAEVHRKYDDHQLVFEEYFGADGKPYYQVAGYCKIQQEWSDGVLYSRTYLDSDAKPVNRVDGYSKAVWEKAENCTNIRFYNVDGEEVGLERLNLFMDVYYNEDGWSDWMIPGYDKQNSCFNIGSINLGEKEEGYVYTSTIEIEFKDVTATEGKRFRFFTQGAQDGQWGIGNVWNSNLVYLERVLGDGVYIFTSTEVLSEKMVDINSFNVGFRSDYWATGMYRVRNVKIVKGDIAYE